MEDWIEVRAFTAFAPGRVCLFGEHQDYLGWPVVAGAIDLGCQIRFTPLSNERFEVELPDIGARATWPNPPTGRPFNYLAAAWQEQPVQGWLATVTGNLPREAGASSSTALVTAFALGLAAAAQVACGAEDLARKAHRAEVTAQGEPGGQMDHLAIAHGGLHEFHFDGQPAQQLPIPDAVCLLVDTHEPKSTLAVLERAKLERTRLVAAPGAATSPEEKALLRATERSRDVSAAGTEALRGGDLQAAGLAMTEHHAFLRDVLGVSTKRLEAALEAARNAGAYGGKLNGSGGGGTAVVLLPDDNVSDVMRAVHATGSTCHLVQLGAPGAHILAS